MDNALKLRVMFDMVDNMTKPLKNVLAGNKSLAHSLKQTRRELAEMSKKQKDIAEFREIRQGLASTTSQLRAAQARVTNLAGAMRAVGPPTRSMVRQFEDAKRVAAGLAAQHERQSAHVHRLREQLSAAGISTRSLAEHQRNLSAQTRTATRRLQEQEEALTRASRQQQKLHAARAQLNGAKQLAVSAAATSAAGGAMASGTTAIRCGPRITRAPTGISRKRSGA